MIDKKELRIGNFANYYIDKTWKEGIIECINKTTCTINSQTVKHRNIEPIGLTEEWLLKFGFELKDGWFEKSSLKLFNINDLYFTTPSKDIIRVDITSIHQLQNLYFALAGKELELKPKL